MPCKVIGLIQVKDQAAFDTYRMQVGDTLTRFDGQILRRGKIADMPWNELRIAPCEAMVEIEFPTIEAAKQWANSPEYQNLLRIRERAMDLSLILSE